MSKAILYIGLLIFGVLLTAEKFNTDVPITFTFDGVRLIFPITVGDAFKKYMMSYKPPGYYFSQPKRNYIVSLEYEHEPDDFRNEHQPKEVLFNRKVYSYIYSFTAREGLQDSLRLMLEEHLKKEMVMSIDTQRFGLVNMPNDLQRKLPNNGVVSYGLISKDSLLTIGLRQKPSFSNNTPQKIEIILFYNRSQEQIKKRMMSY